MFSNVLSMSLECNMETSVKSQKCRYDDQKKPYVIFLASPDHSITTVKLFNQETQDGCLGVRRQCMKGFGP